MRYINILMYYIFLPCTVLSLVCVLALVATWWLMPRWRSLQNYMTINRIVFGTIHLIFLYGYFYKCVDVIVIKDEHVSYVSTCQRVISNLEFGQAINEVVRSVFLTSVCWSCASLLVAYIRLRLRFTGTVENERKKVLQLTYLSVIFISLFCELLQTVFFKLDVSNVQLRYRCMRTVKVIPPLLLTTLNLCLFFKVSESFASFKTSMGVALVCDTVIVGLMPFERHGEKTSINEYSENAILTTSLLALCFRLIPQCLIILFNNSTKKHWRLYMKRRHRMTLNDPTVRLF